MFGGGCLSSLNWGSLYPLGDVKISLVLARFELSVGRVQFRWVGLGRCN